MTQEHETRARLRTVPTIKDCDFTKIAAGIEKGLYVLVRNCQAPYIYSAEDNTGKEGFNKSAKPQKGKLTDHKFLHEIFRFSGKHNRRLVAGVGDMAIVSGGEAMEDLLKEEYGNKFSCTRNPLAIIPVINVEKSYEPAENGPEMNEVAP